MSTTTIRPMACYVVAQAEKKTDMTASGIYLPESAQDKSEAAVVLTVGSEVKDVKAGDQIVYKNYAATKMKVDDEEYMLIKNEDVLGVIETKKKGAK